MNKKLFGIFGSLYLLVTLISLGTVVIGIYFVYAILKHFGIL